VSRQLADISQVERTVRGRSDRFFSVDLLPAPYEAERWAIFLADGTLIGMKAAVRIDLGDGFTATQAQTIFLTPAAVQAAFVNFFGGL
jgi:hypothetical protein